MPTLWVTNLSGKEVTIEIQSSDTANEIYRSIERFQFPSSSRFIYNPLLTVFPPR